MPHFFFSHKKRLLPLLLLLLFVCSAILFQFLQGDNAVFENLCEKIFIQAVSEDGISLHYTLAFPEKYNIMSKDAVLPTYTENSRVRRGNLYRDTLQELSEIDEKKMNFENRHTLRLLKNRFSLAYALDAYPYFEEPLAPSSGMHQTLPILFSEYRFRRIKDIEDYLSLLSQTDEYFQSLVEYEKIRKASGHFLPPASVSKVVGQCQNFISLSSIEDESHFLVSGFRERLLTFQEEFPHVLSDEKVEVYLAKNKEILKNHVFPGYILLADELSGLSDSSFTYKGLGSFPEGKDYYTLLVKQYTGTERDMEEIRNFLYSHFEKLYHEVSSLSSTLQFEEDSDENPFKEKNAEQQLSALKKGISDSFPPLERDVHCSIKQMDDSFAAYAAPAFYLAPPLDDYRDNVIYINPRSPIQGLSGFSTLAHEGYPGHLYQSVYSRIHWEKETLPIRAVLNFEGYCEGFAVYGELFSYRLMPFTSSKQAEYACKSHSLQLNLYALLDFLCHYDAASESRICSLLEGFGVPRENAEKTYRYLCEEPGIYLKYYLSYLEIMELKKKAETLWNDSYSDYRFHTFLLDAGPSDFSSLNIRLEELSHRP